MTVSSVGLRTTGLYGDTDCGCRRQATPSLGFCFPLFSPEKRVPHPAFRLFWFVSAVIGFCHRLTLCQIWLKSRYGTCVVYIGKTHRHRKLQLMFSSPSFVYQTWRRGSLPRGWRHTKTLAIEVSPRASKSVRSLWNTCVTPLNRHKLLTDAGLRSSLRPLSDILGLWKQKSALWQEGVSSRKDFRWYEAFLPARGRENQERSAWLDAADCADWRSCPAGPSW